MTVLLDTVVALWLDRSPDLLSRDARQLIEDGQVRCFLSVVSIWEIEVKSASGKLTMAHSVREAIDRLIATYRIELLDLKREACHQQSRLPLFHRDPFDRLLMCQGIAEGIPLVTPDAAFARYPVKVLW